MTAILVLAIIAAVAGGAFALSPKGWRTVVVNGAIGVLAIAGEVVNFALGFDWKTVIPPEYAPWAILSLNVVNIVLRGVTTGPIGRKP